MTPTAESKENETMVRNTTPTAPRDADETRTICVWLDSTGEAAADPVWIVSRDLLDGTGGATHTETLRTCESRSEAVAVADEIARAEGLPLSVQETR